MISMSLVGHFFIFLLLVITTCERGEAITGLNDVGTSRMIDRRLNICKLIREKALIRRKRRGCRCDCPTDIPCARCKCSCDGEEGNLKSGDKKDQKALVERKKRACYINCPADKPDEPCSSICDSPEVLQEVFERQHRIETSLGRNGKDEGKEESIETSIGSTMDQKALVERKKRACYIDCPADKPCSSICDSPEVLQEVFERQHRIETSLGRNGKDEGKEESNVESKEESNDERKEESVETSIGSTMDQ